LEKPGLFLKQVIDPKVDMRILRKKFIKEQKLELKKHYLKMLKQFEQDFKKNLKKWLTESQFFFISISNNFIEAKENS
jgi:hypothetical protein